MWVIVFSLGLVTTFVYLFTSQTRDVAALVNHESSGESTAPLSWALSFHQAGDEIMWAPMASDGDGVILPLVEYDGGNQILLKVDKKGTLVWQRAPLWMPIGEPRSAVLQIEPTTDGGYITRFGNPRFGISKLDVTGGEVWSKTYNLPHYGETQSNYIQQTSDGGYIMAGTGAFCSFFQCAAVAMVVIKVDVQGTIMWAHNYPDLSVIKSVQETQDGGYILLTFSQMVKLDSQGVVIWANQYGNVPPQPEMESVQLLNDGGYIVTGKYYPDGSGQPYCWAMRLSANGLVSWEKMYTPTTNDVWSGASLEIVEDGFVLPCNLRPDPNNQNDRDFALLKLDGNGDIVWQKRYGGSGADGVMNLIATEEGYFVAGISNSSSQGDFDIMLWRLDANGDICACDFVHEENSVVAVETTSQVTDLVITAQDVIVTTGEFELLDEASDPFSPSFWCMSPQDKVTATIPPTGGSFTSSDGQTEFIFPSGAFSDTVSITYFHWYDQNVGGFGQMNRTFELTAVYSDTQQPATLAPSQTFTITVHYGPTGPGTIIEETMALYAGQDEQWIMEESSTLDINAKTLTAVPDHLGWFAALGETNRIHLPTILKGLRP